ERKDELARRRLERRVVGEDDELVAVRADAELRERPPDLGQAPPERVEVLAHALHGEPGVEQRHRGLEREKILKIIVKTTLLPDPGPAEAGLRPVPEPRLGEAEDLRGIDEGPEPVAHETNPSTSRSTCTREPSARARTSTSRRAKGAPARSTAAAAA